MCIVFFSFAGAKVKCFYIIFQIIWDLFFCFFDVFFEDMFNKVEVCELGLKKNEAILCQKKE